MMIAHEPEMRDQRAEIMPAGKLMRLDHHAVQDAVTIKIVVDVISERRKIGRFKRAIRFQYQDAVIEAQVVIEHCGLPLSEQRVVLEEPPARRRIVGRAVKRIAAEGREDAFGWAAGVAACRP